MDTQTQPELKEPEIPIDVALDTEDGSRIDVCVQDNTFQKRLVHVYIRDSGIDINALLKKAESLESRVFEGERTNELRERFLGLTSSLKPLIDIKRDDDSYLMEYELSYKEQIYDAMRRL